VVLAGDGDVLQAGGLRECDPFRGVECHGIELRRQLLVVADRNLAVVHHPLAVPEHAVDAPMHEQAEARILEPLARGEIRRSRPIAALRMWCRSGLQPHRGCRENPKGVFEDRGDGHMRYLSYPALTSSSY